MLIYPCIILQGKADLKRHLVVVHLTILDVATCFYDLKPPHVSEGGDLTGILDRVV